MYDPVTGRLKLGNLQNWQHAADKYCRPHSLNNWLALSCRRMYDPATGHFEQGNIQDWQHAAMYSAFLVSGVVDLIGFYTSPGTLPAGTEHVPPPPSPSHPSPFLTVLTLNEFLWRP